MTEPDDTFDRWKTVIDGQCATATPQQFRNRLEIALLIYAYVAKRFAERYPEEYAQWDAEQA